MASRLPTRVNAVDIGRTVALFCMVVFHTVHDLEIFGILAEGTTLTGFWYLFARLIAGSFFFFAGVSLVLAHPDQIRWRAFWHRLLILTSGALLVTIATYTAMPSRFVYFGILHSIAVSSFLALPFLRFPPFFSLAAALSILALPLIDFHPLGSPVWSFSGLSSTSWPSLDFLPVVPWLAFVLLGVTVGKQWQPKATRLTSTLSIWGWPGRHSLAIYLLHQPILIAVIWLVLQVN